MIDLRLNFHTLGNLREEKPKPKTLGGQEKLILQNKCRRIVSEIKGWDAHKTLRIKEKYLRVLQTRHIPI